MCGIIPLADLKEYRIIERAVEPRLVSDGEIFREIYCDFFSRITIMFCWSQHQLWLFKAWTPSNSWYYDERYMSLVDEVGNYLLNFILESYQHFCLLVAISCSLKCKVQSVVYERHFKMFKINPPLREEHRVTLDPFYYFSSYLYYFLIKGTLSIFSIQKYSTPISL